MQPRSSGRLSRMLVTTMTAGCDVSVLSWLSFLWSFKREALCSKGIECLCSTVRGRIEPYGQRSM